jgi:hypothetical protein
VAHHFVVRESDAVADVRQRLERQVGRAVPDAIWEYLDDRGFVGDADFDFDQLVDEARRLLEFSQQPSGGRPQLARRRSRRTSAPQWATSRWFFHAAAEEPDVVTFRSEALGGHLIAWEEVGSWLDAHSGPEPYNYVTARVQSSAELDGSGGRMMLRRATPIIRTSTEHVAFALPGDTWVRRCVVSSPTLERVARLTERLGRHYPWQPSQATVFLLAGITPLVSQLRVTSGMPPMSNGLVLGAAERVVLEIDPALPVAEVVRAYQDVCRSVGYGSYRALSDKHAELAAFGLDRDEGSTWAATLAAWNAKFTGWRYDHVSNFRRDAARAIDRVARQGQ